MAQWLTNPTSIHEDAVQSLAWLSGLRIWHCVSCGVGRRYSSDPSLLWLWLWLCLWLAAPAPIRPPAWEPPYATSAALKRPKTKKIFLNKINK